ncbi:Rz1-like lysis system protein LysC [Collimonas sp. NPDC087041]|uniref:Rz1-like lysis system protein LysC n=1 Tax=Collimonas sp. NPDC087041 TaxID=3363960 RepID=UPI003800DD7D
MTIQICKPGLILLCLTLLSSCGTAPPQRAPTLLVNACPAVTRCSRQAATLTTNGSMLLALERAKAALTMCAAKVDTVVDCQEKIDVQAEKP